MSQLFDRAKQKIEQNKLREQGVAVNTGSQLTVQEKAKGHEVLNSHCYLRMSDFEVDYEKTFGDLVYLGYSTETYYPETDTEKAGQIRDRRYQVFSETHLQDFIVIIPFEVLNDILVIEPGTPVTLSNPSLRALSFLANDNRSFIEQFNVTVDNIVVKGASQSQAQSAPVEQPKTDNKNDKK